MNPMTQTDFYKVNHKFQYPEGTNLVFSNFTARSGKHFNREVEGVVFLGLQKFIQEHLIEEWTTNFFAKQLDEVILPYKRRIETSLGKGAIDFEHITELWELGYLPLRIRALPEGMIVPFKVPMFTVENTNPKFFWLTNYLETVLSTEIWKPTTVATIAREYRLILEKYAAETGTDPATIPFSLHDFSMRGMSGKHDAANSGVGHLLSFSGTDNIAAIDCAEDYYGANAEKELIGTGIPATEHSVMCAGGKEDEFETYRRIICDLYPNGFVGIVSDTWDLWKVLTEIAPALKKEIMTRDGRVVFRPDSGDPADILCGTVQHIVQVPEGLDVSDYCIDTLTNIAISSAEHGEPGDEKVSTIAMDSKGNTFKVTAEIFWNRYDKQYYFFDGLEKTVIEDHILSNEEKGAVQILWEQFGGGCNDKGFKEIDPHVGLIYGDSITLDRCEDICRRLKAKGFASGNVVFGVGSYTYQMITRDTFGMAMKSTYCEVNGEGREIFKDPITDDGIKKSAKGLLRVVLKSGEYTLQDQVSWKQVNSLLNEMQVVFQNGDTSNFLTLGEMRANVEKSL